MKTWHRIGLDAVTEEWAFHALRIAQLNEHRGNNSDSAIACARDAERAFNAGDYGVAFDHAMSSIACSCSIYSPQWADAINHDSEV